MKLRVLVAGILLAAGVSTVHAAQAAGAAPVSGTELRLWPGKAPGSENWQYPETITTSQSGDRIASNVTDPTLTVYLPDAAKANGAAVVIAPGGALRLLGLDNEGVKVARWLNERGIAAFVLKYRTLQLADPDAPLGAPAGMPGVGRTELVIRNANANPDPDNAALREVLTAATADAQAALQLVRRNAAQWQIDPKRVGFMGFSAGGGVAVALTLGKPEGGAPDFLVSLYGPSLIDVNVPPDAPPLFIAVGSEHFNVTNGCLALFEAWRAARRPAEIHVYDQVKAGFGMTPRGLPVDGWIDRLQDWLIARNLARKQ